MEKLKLMAAACVLVVLVFVVKFVFAQDGFAVPTGKNVSEGLSYETTAKRDLLALMMAYPEEITGIKNESGKVYVEIHADVKVIYDDMRSKSFEEKLADADLQDMMEIAYPLSNIDTIQESNTDPGRIRDYVFLKSGLRQFAE